MISFKKAKVSKPSQICDQYITPVTTNADFCFSPTLVPMR